MRQTAISSRHGPARICPRVRSCSLFAFSLMNSPLSFSEHPRYVADIATPILWQ
jgi:hypothetical protein